MKFPDSADFRILRNFLDHVEPDPDPVEMDERTRESPSTRSGAAGEAVSENEPDENALTNALTNERVNNYPTLPYVYAGVAGGYIVRGPNDGAGIFALLLEHRETENKRVKVLFSRQGLTTLRDSINSLLADVEQYPGQDTEWNDESA